LKRDQKERMSETWARRIRRSSYSFGEVGGGGVPPGEDALV
jgi:hypothetical protein